MKQPLLLIKTVLPAALICLVSVMLNAQDAAHDRLRQVITANSLIEPGKAPFHLQMAFQYYDLQAKPADAGVLEEWWTAPDSFLITVALPSINQGRPTPIDNALKIDPREEYTLRRLLKAETDPVSGTYADAVKSITEFKKRVGKNELTCFGPSEGQTDVCIDPQGNGIRLQTTLKSIVTMRNTPGIFEKTNIAYDLAIAYGGIPAISGHLQDIETFSPTQSVIVIPLHTSDSVKTSDSTGVVPGKVIKHAEAEFPLHMLDYKGSWTSPSGTWRVLVSCRVMKDGTTSGVFALNSPDPAFTQSAIDVVEKYRFEPFLFQGKPVEVAIEVEVSFQR